MTKKVAMSLAAAVALAVVTVPAFAKSYTVKELSSSAAGTFMFEPDYLHVNPGDTVTFEPATPGHDSKSFLVPAGAKGWAGSVGKPITVTFKKDGVYLYECVPHHLFGMLGVIEVGKPVNKAAAEKAAAAMEKAEVMNKGRLTKLMADVK